MEVFELYLSGILAVFLAVGIVAVSWWYRGGRLVVVWLYRGGMLAVC